MLHRSDPPQIAEPVGIDGNVQFGQIAPFAACEKIDAIIASLGDPVVLNRIANQAGDGDPFLDVTGGPHAVDRVLD